MPSELQRVARGLVDCLDEVPQVVAHLHRTAARCRENAAAAIAASRGRATTAALQLDAAANACEEAAHYLAMAPPKATAWAERLIGPAGQRREPAPGSADRNRATRGKPGSERDEQGRIIRTSGSLVASRKGAQSNEPALVELGRVVLATNRRTAAKSLPVTIEVFVDDHGEFQFADADADADADSDADSDSGAGPGIDLDPGTDSGSDTGGVEISVTVAAAAKELLQVIRDHGEDHWQHAVLVVDEFRVDLTVDYGEPARVADKRAGDPDAEPREAGDQEAEDRKAEEQGARRSEG